MDYSNNFNDLNGYDTFFNMFSGTMFFIVIVIFAFLLLGIILCIIANWKMFKKAGRNGWECIIPFYSYWVLIEISGLNWWWFLLIIADSIVSMLGDTSELASIANLVSLFASFNCYYNIAKKFGKSTGISVCAGIFSFIFILIFGFSKKEVYDNSIAVSANGIFGGNTTNNMNNTTNDYQNINQQPMNNNVEQSTNTVDMNNVSVQNYSFCGNCGTRLENGIRFCPNCGKEKN